MAKSRENETKAETIPAASVTGPILTTAEIADRLRVCIKQFRKHEEWYIRHGLVRLRKGTRGRSALYLESSVAQMLSNVAHSEEELP